MGYQALVFLALSAIAAAHPRRHEHLHFGTGHRHGIGHGTGHLPRPTGGTYPQNGTWGSSNIDIGAGPSMESLPVMTVTVSPLPATASVESDSSAFTVAAIATDDSSDVAAASTAEVLECSSSSTSTTTSTSTSYVTVTITPDSQEAWTSPEAVTTSEVATTSEASATAEVSATSEGSTTADVSAASAPAISALESPSSTVSLDTESVSAGAFFGRPSGAGGFSYSRGSPSVPTTFATVSASAASYGSPAASSSWSSSSPSSSSPSSGPSDSSGGKKGLSYNTASLTDAFAGKGITWAYNWGSGPDGSIVSGAEYVPMLWGLSSTGGWSSAASSAISGGSQHVLSFNEPDLSSQSNISPSDAASNHIKFMNPLAGQAQIGSPAITNGAGSSPPMGTTWLQQFFDNCGGNCKVDFVAFHWYADASNIAYFKQHVQDVINTAASNGVSKVWLTEFGASGSDSDVASFIAEATSFLDSTPAVERYAYFMCSDGLLVSGNSLSTIGQAYAA